MRLGLNTLASERQPRLTPQEKIEQPQNLTYAPGYKKM